MDDLRGSLDRALGGLRFHSAMKNAVKEKTMTERQGRCRFPLRAAALAVCAALVITAAAAGPGIWERLTGNLGPLAPYLRPAEGTASGQGIQVELVGSVSDAYTARIYFTVTDAQKRLNDHTDADMDLEGEFAGSGGSFRSEIQSYDPETGQLLMAAYSDGLDIQKPVTLTITGLNPGCRYAGARFAVPAEAETLKTAVTAEGETVLLPGQTPQRLPECEGISISSAGFDGDGLFHVRLAFDEGFSDTVLSITPESRSRPHQGLYRADCTCTPVEGGLDFRFPKVTPETLADLDSLYLHGPYQGPEEEITGNWSIPVTLERVEQRTLDLSGKQAGQFGLDRVELSPLTVAVFYERPAGGPPFLFESEIEVTKADGTAAALRDGLCSPVNTDSGRTAYTLTYFTEPMDLDEIAAISLMGETVWTNPE